MQTLNRRHFIRNCLAAAPVVAALSTKSTQAQEPAAMPPLCVFSKHLQFLDYKALASTCRELGLDGVDLTVRGGGHVLPEQVTTKLPEAVEAIRAEGLDVPMLTTPFSNDGAPHFRQVLETARDLGIRYLRIGVHRYDQERPVLEQIDTFTAEVRGLVDALEEFDLVAGYHNHSGRNYFGAPMWDLHRMYEAIDSPRLGSNFDVGHAVVEGAYGDWEITARLLAPWVRMVAVKDFVFTGNRPRWRPLGQGVVDVAEFLRIFREEAAFSGPVSLHFEYGVRNNDEMIEEIGKAVQYMREEVFPKAGY